MRVILPRWSGILFSATEDEAKSKSRTTIRVKGRLRFDRLRSAPGCWWRSSTRKAGASLTLPWDDLGLASALGSSEELQRVLSQFGKVAPTHSTVLILRETGTGRN
jgi:hypothetical protein